MPLMSWQLWLAKDLVVEKRLPWQSAIISLTLGRVAQCVAGHPPRSMFSLLVAIGTPAQSPKPRGKSPGWAKGNIRTKPPRYPTVKKADAIALRFPQRALHQARASRPKKVPKVAT